GGGGVGGAGGRGGVLRAHAGAGFGGGGGLAVLAVANLGGWAGGGGVDDDAGAPPRWPARRGSGLGRSATRPRGVVGGERCGGGADGAGPAGGGVAAGGALALLRAVDAAGQGPGWAWRPSVRPGAVCPLEPEEHAMTTIQHTYGYALTHSVAVVYDE